MVITLHLHLSTFAQESIVGIGVSLGQDSKTGELKIVQVIPGGPAALAGLKGGLVLRKIDGFEVTGKKMTECIPLIRGPIGSKVKLDLFDPAENGVKHFEVTRDQIVIAKPKRAERGDPRPL